MRRISLSKKVASLLSITALCTMFLAASSDACAKTFYLKPSSNWQQANARFAVYAFGSGEAWFNMSAVSDNTGYYQAAVDDKYTTVIFCRMNPSTAENDWKNKWNQTQDMPVESGKDLCVISDGTWDNNGSWSTYNSGDPSVDPEPVTPEDYGTAVPSECTDVMLQAFYWKSNVNSGYGDTKWATLEGQVNEIAQSFTMVWLPPSSQASGISAGGLGYIPLEYSSPSCLMGKRAALESLIGALHNNGVRVLADIVINHIGNPSGNCTLKAENFGSYGSYTPTKDWLTSNDEGNCGSNGNADDGQHEANYGAARDWDHKNTNVQNMCKSYLKWLKGELKYDGFRYDYVGGYHVSHINDYNSEAKPYFSVIEYWIGDANELKTRIDQAGKNTLAFDFAAKYTAFRDGIYNKNYAKCKNAGLRGNGYSKYAVTFIDNHDTFNRGNDAEDVANKRDGSSINDVSLMMRCHAYLLSMPGVPCVFYPHWVKYKSEIKAMINARRMAGVHSESSVQEESGNGYYRATIQGKYGSVKLMLGSAANDATPAGYTQAVKGTDYAMYYTGTGPQGVENVQIEQKGEKFIENGQLYIRCGEYVFDAQGRRMN